MSKIYLAGPLFTAAEREWNRQLKRELIVRGFAVWLPQEHEPREGTARAIFEMDVEGLNWATNVVAIMDGPDPDSGTSWEVGYAYAKDKPILCIRTDMRTVKDATAPYNLMLTESADLHIEFPAEITPSELAQAIREII